MMDDFEKLFRKSFEKPANDLYEMELIGDHQMRIGVPIDAPEELKRRVLAAMKSYQARLKSVDYTLKRYGEYWKYPDPSEEESFLLYTLRALDQRVETTVDQLCSGTQRESQYGSFAAEAALIRLKPTFRSAYYLIMQGYPFEAAAMCRIILEQISWAYFIRNIDDEETVSATNPTKTISAFKVVMPEAGKLYGLLSSHTHLDPKNTDHYITKSDSSISINFHLPAQTKTVLYYLLKLYFKFYEVSMAVSGRHQEIVEEKLYDWIPNYITDSEKLMDAIKRLEPEIEIA